MLDSELRAFLEEGLIIHVATRNDTLEPNGARATAVTADEDGLHVVAFVPVVAAGEVLQDMQSNGGASLLVTRPTDDRGCQVKGTFVGARDARPEEQAMVVAQWERARETLEQIGVPRAATDAWAAWPCVAVRLRVNAVFDQTPGPGAGAPLP